MGQNAMKISSQFHGKLLFIKKHLDNKKHPISSLINHFKAVYSCQYYFLMMKNKQVFLQTYNRSEQKDDQDLHMVYKTKLKTQEQIVKNNVKVLKTEIKGSIKCLVH